MVQGVVSLTAIIGFGGAVAAVGSQFRRGDPLVRQQTKWLLATAGVAAVAFPLAFVIPLEVVANAMFLVGFLALLGLPAAIGIAVLRYRLYEIDRLISRTIGWALVTGVLVAVFAAGAIALQAILAGVTQGQTLAIAASTLVTFALFQPLRRRVQHGVDRRFDRARYDGERTAAAFAERLRGQVDLAGLEADITGTVDAVLRPSFVRTWLRTTVPVPSQSRFP